MKTYPAATCHQLHIYTTETDTRTVSEAQTDRQLSSTVSQPNLGPTVGLLLDTHHRTIISPSHRPLTSIKYTYRTQPQHS